MAYIKMYKKGNSKTDIQVEFESASITAYLKVYRCTNPYCPCKTMSIYFYDMKAESDNLLFTIELNYETWQIESKEVHKHDMDYTEFITEFMKATDDQFVKYIHSLVMPEAKAEHNLRNNIDPALGRGKGMVYYHEIYHIPPYEDIVIEHEDKKYFVEDCYCPNPNCHCMDVVLSFYLVKDNISYSETILAYRVSFKTGRKRIESIDPVISQHLGNELYNELLTYVHSNGLDFFKNRYHKIKEWGASLHAPQVANTIPIVYSEPKPGRNDLCPCGSGKKYKKCCGSNYRDIQ